MSETWHSPEVFISRFKLAIDPGHGQNNRGNGRFDPGSVNGKLREADIALQWGLELHTTLIKLGIDSWMTRANNTTPVPLGQRVRRAVEAGCTHYLSIHCDGVADKSAHGSEAIYRDKNDKAFAQMVLDAALKATGLTDRGVRPEADTHVGKLAIMAFPGPCTLLEVGFITNPSDAAVIADPKRMQVFATAFAARLQAKPAPFSTLPNGSRLVTDVSQIKLYDNKNRTAVADAQHGAWVHIADGVLHVRPVLESETKKL